MLDDIDLDIPENGPSKRGGGSFRLIMQILGLVLVLALIAAAVYFFVILPARPAAPLPQDEVAAQLTSTAAEVLAATEEEAAATNTATSRPRTNTPTATEITPIFTAVVNEETATVQSLLTQAALAQTQAAGGVVATATATLPSALPDSGFADDVGLPGLFGATALLLVVILLARRLRSAER